MAIAPHAEESRQHDADAAFCATTRAPAEAAFQRRSELVSASKQARDAGDKAKAKVLSDEAKAEGVKVRTTFHLRSGRVGTVR